MDLFSDIMATFPVQPEDPPFGHYVYSITIDGKVRYVGKGSGFRAWSHFPAVMTLLRKTLAGEDTQDALFFHKMLVRYLARCKGKLSVRVNILFQGLTEAQSYRKEEALIRSLPIYQVNISHESEGLWNIGGRGLEVNSRVSLAAEAHKAGESPKRYVGRNRPGKKDRQDSKFMFGEFGNGSVN